jgi:hypothetical protein
MLGENTNTGLTLIEMVITLDRGATDIAEHGVATLAAHFVASRFLDTSLCAFGAFSNESLAHGLFYCVSMVERIILGS